MENRIIYTPIKQWAQEDRPREKLMLHGKGTLSQAELLAILISTGTKSKSAIDLAREILKKCGDDINHLAKMSVKELVKIDGIGEAKAISIVAAIELGGRRQIAEVKQKKSIGHSKDIYDLFKPKLADLMHEEFWILLLNQGLKIIGERQVSEGGMTSTAVDARKIFRLAIDEGAASIALAHNHPSGSLKPSNEDILLTNRLKEAGKLLDVKVIDHVIVAETGFYSFADEGML
ncbi:MAG: JAB domain-containing protein [Bacteroidetes bacterium]|nr:MAG: JAB domain-containing protein [Bacteroidota bacterium]